MGKNKKAQASKQESWWKAKLRERSEHDKLKRKQSETPLGRFLHPYYVLNALSILLYYPVRVYWFHGDTALMSEDVMGISRETQIGFTLVMYLTIKFKKAPTFEKFAAQLFMFSKLAVLVCCFTVDFRVAVWFLLLYTALILAQQPEYKGPSKVTVLDPMTFETMVENSKEDVFWLVEFYTTWADDCVQFSSLFASLSLRFESQGMKFAKIDVGRWNNIASKYAIDISTSSKQLPTLMLFHKGQAQHETRLPPKAESSDKGLRAKFTNIILTKQSIIEVYELNERTLYVPSISGQAKDVKQPKTGKLRKRRK